MIKKWIVPALKFLVSALLIWFLLGRIDIADTGGRLIGVSFTHVGSGPAWGAMTALGAGPLPPSAKDRYDATVASSSAAVPG